MNEYHIVGLETSNYFDKMFPYKLFLKIGKPLMCTSANSEDPDVKVHYMAFHQGLHCLLRTNQSSGNEYNIFLKL